MKFSTVLFAAGTLASAALAQKNPLDYINDFPKCAQQCLLTGVSATTCGLDIKCVCTTQAFFDKTVPCIQTNCEDKEEDSARDAAIKLCKEVGGVDVTDKLPPAHEGSTPPPTTPPVKPSPCKARKFRA
ncbi:hypothetical protein TWF696_005761 [Orbilia brochopaga]|uniref:CFEM domain-containing protein n=1 Tax=Orbilia brochopaga TaxID=3140254 RepID=A0AAV9UY65_9PEZI